eukprot:m.297183 g.297183  ORF g.297183 m.297183 type:complete len:124 (-) comp27197_c0_seq2:398-769(-)
MWRVATAARGVVRSGGLGRSQRRFASGDAVPESAALNRSALQTMAPIPIAVALWFFLAGDSATDMFDTRMPVDERKAIIHAHLRRTRAAADQRVKISHLPSHFGPRAPCPSPGEGVTNVGFGQ